MKGTWPRPSTKLSQMERDVGRHADAVMQIRNSITGLREKTSAIGSLRDAIVAQPDRAGDYLELANLALANRHLVEEVVDEAKLLSTVIANRPEVFTLLKNSLKQGFDAAKAARHIVLIHRNFWEDKVIDSAEIHLKIWRKALEKKQDPATIFEQLQRAGKAHYAHAPKFWAFALAKLEKGEPAAEAIAKAAAGFKTSGNRAFRQ